MVHIDPNAQANAVAEINYIRYAMSDPSNISSSDSSAGSPDLSDLDSALAALATDLSQTSGTVDADAVAADLNAIASAGLDPSDLDAFDSAGSTPTDPNADPSNGASANPQLAAMGGPDGPKRMSPTIMVCPRRLC